MKVLGIDPGTATTGFGVVEGQSGRASLVDYGTIRTSAGRDMARRLLEIHKQLDELIQKYQPVAMAVEEIFSTVMPKQSSALARLEEWY